MNRELGTVNLFGCGVAALCLSLFLSFLSSWFDLEVFTDDGERINALR